MEVSKDILNRCNTKNFTSKLVSWEKVSLILEAGRLAPSSGNIQNWKFIVIMDPDKKFNVARACYDNFNLIKAPIFIIVCSEPEIAERYYGLRGQNLYSTQNATCALMNMWIQATHLGLDVGWVGHFREKELMAELSIPDNVRPQGVLVVGYGKKNETKSSRYPLENLVYFGNWGNKMSDPASYANDIATILARKAQKSLNK